MLSGNTYSPTATSDNGTAGTLRAAVASANADPGVSTDTIQLASGTYMLTLGELDVTNTAHSLVIDGQGSTGPNATVIDQLSLDRVFQIAAGAAVTFENLEITGGIADDDDTGSSATVADGGGVLSDGSLTLENVLVTGNKALATAASENAQGGGVYATGSLTINGGSVIEGNSAVVQTAPSSNGGYAVGGGIFSSTGDAVNISGSTIAGNAALGGANANGGDSGAAIGGGIYISNSGSAAVVLNDDTISGNQVIGGTGASGEVGGIAYGGGVDDDVTQLGSGAPVQITNSTLSYNIVQAGAVGSGGVGGFAFGGGANFLSGGSQLLDDTVYGNSATGGAGPTAGNAAGGGICDDTGVESALGLSLVNVTVAYNVAQAGTPSAGGTAGTSSGGGLDNDNSDPSLTVSNSLIAENTAGSGPDVSGAAATTDHNLVGDYDASAASGFSSLNGDQLGSSGSPINPLLGPLQNNGGNTATAALLAGSTAIDGGDSSAATTAGLSYDQRGIGFGRIVGTAVDVGAYEVQASAATATTLGTITTPMNVGQSVALSAGVSASGTPTGTVTFEDTVNGTTTTLGTAPLASGSATLTILSLPAGSNSVTAVYSGDATFNGSNSAPQPVVVNLASGTPYAPSATAADGTVGSLRAAVALANAAAGASTIVLSSGVYSLTQGELNYTNTAGTLTIIGQGSSGPNATVINQLSLDRVLSVAAGATVVLENVELTGGVADTDQSGGSTEADGGGTLVNGSLSLDNTAVLGNRALALGQTNAVGGGIYVTATGSLTVTGTTPGASLIDDNSSIAAAGAAGSGYSGYDAYAGGLMFSGGVAIQVTGTTVAGNAAVAGAGGSGGNGVAGGYGGFAVVGGLYTITNGTGTAVLNDDTITSNFAQGAAGGAGGFGAGGGLGGPVFAGGLAMDNDGSVPGQLTDVTVTDNTVQGGAGGAGGVGAQGAVGGDVDGGGAYLHNAATSATAMVVEGNTFSGNVAQGGAGGTGLNGGYGGGANGGGVYFDGEEDAPTESQGDTFSGNTAEGGIGGAGAVGGSNGSGGPGAGGGVYISDNTPLIVSLTQDTITGNQALGGIGASTKGENAAYGGGIVSNSSGPVQINDSTISNNSALGGAGATGVSGVKGDDGSAADGDNGGAGAAGGIYLYNSGATPPTLTADTLMNNTAQGGTGGAGASSGSGGNGGNVFAGGLLIAQGSGAATVSDTLIAYNTATGGTGGSAGNGGTMGSGGNAAGGGLMTLSTGTELLNSTVFENTLTGGGGFNAGSAYGGGIEDETGPNAPGGMSLVNVTVAANTAQAGSSAGGTSGSAYGGGIDNNFAADTALVIDNTLVANNNAETSASAEIEANGPDFYGPAATALNNLVNDGNGATGFTGNGNQLGPSVTVVPGLAAGLANNGGTTETVALTATSSALGAGSVTAANAFGLTTDQRGAGFSRIVNGAVDIGAYETQSLVVTPSGTTNTFTIGSSAVAVDAGVTVSFSGADLTGATVTISSGTLQTGDTLQFTNQNGITGSYFSGVLTLSGSATAAQYQTALQSVTFSTTSGNTTTRSISIVAVDYTQSSAPAAESVKVATAAQPHIAVTGNTQAIADGAATTSANNDTAFSSTAVGSSSTETYTITNSGTAALTLGTVSIGGTNSGDFKVTTQPSGSVAPGSSTTFVVQFKPTATGPRAATLSFTENDPTAASPFTFAISGAATAATSYISVAGNGQPIVIGSTTTSATNGTAFASTPVGSSLSETYTITNNGTAGLSVGSLWVSGTNAGDFSVTTQPGTWVLPGQTTTFTVKFKPTATGARAAVIDFYENEGGSPNTLFTFAVSGVCGAAAQPRIAVTGGSQPIADGATTTSATNDTAFSSTAVGNSSSETYTITNSGTAALTLGTVSIGGTNSGDFKVTTQPSGSVAPGSSTTFVVQFKPTATGARTATISFTENDPTAASPFKFAISGAATAATTQPHIAVTGNAQAIADGATSTSATNDTAFSSTKVGSSSTETYTITNSGTAALTLGTVSIGGTNSGDFKVTKQPSGSVAAGSSTTFTVQFTPTASGTRTAMISFTENDPTAASPFTFAISGAATAAASYISVTGNGQPIALGSTTTSTTNGTAYGSTKVGSSLSETFTITNTGTAGLSVGSLWVSGTNAADFKITVQPGTYVLPGKTTTFTVKFTPTAAGTRSAVIDFYENESSPSVLFTFAVSGTATAK
ncbi:MAG TPA: choice-of-anchor D domain-containing protein [Pirellulales bacterium]|nr:choice-of-anchor D domain-containing protein [Pirellulales bacterium]